MWLGKGNDPHYTPSTTFETFPFPPGLTPDIPSSDYASEPRAMAVALVKVLGRDRSAVLYGTGPMTGSMNTTRSDGKTCSDGGTPPLINSQPPLAR